jgi:hypothetical protein
MPAPASSGSGRGRMSRGAQAFVAAGLMVGATLIARRAGYRLGPDTVVRCRQGHLFTTVWIPGVSVKSLRLAWWRWQYCPVGRHWSLVSPVRETDLSARQKRSATRHRDVRIP